MNRNTNHSKMVDRRLKAGAAVRRAVLAHTDPVGSLLEGLVQPHLRGGEEAPDLGLIQRLFGRMLEARREALALADQAHRAQVRAVAAPRRRRDEAARRLYQRLVDVRSVAMGLFGPQGAAELLDVKGITPRQPVPLICAATRALRRLEDRRVPLPPVVSTFCRCDRGELAESLRAPIVELGRRLAAVGREQRGAESTLRLKYQALADFDQALEGVLGLLLALYGIAGLGDVAKSLRRAVRGSGRVSAKRASDGPVA